MSNSYLRERDGLDTALPSINGNVRVRGSRIIDIDDSDRHHHHGGHNHHCHHHDDTTKHVRFSSQLSGSTSSLNRADFINSSRDFSSSAGCQARKQVLEVRQTCVLWMIKNSVWRLAINSSNDYPSNISSDIVNLMLSLWHMSQFQIEYSSREFTKYNAPII